MRVYIASQYGRKTEMKGVALQLEAAGILNTSTWLDEPHEDSTPLDGISEELRKEYAQKDLDDIDRADHVLFFSESALTPRGGRHVEFGYALGTGKQIHVVGGPENIFHYLDERVTRHVDLQSYITYMRESFAEAEELL